MGGAQFVAGILLIVGVGGQPVGEHSLVLWAKAPSRCNIQLVDSFRWHPLVQGASGDASGADLSLLGEAEGLPVHALHELRVGGGACRRVRRRIHHV